MPDNTEFPKAAYRYDPYKNFRFRLKWDGKYVAGVSKCSSLTRTTQVITHPDSGDPITPRRMPGQSEYQAITLERGVTHDPVFVQWAYNVWDYTTTKDASLQDFRKDIVLEVYNESGQKVITYNLFRCWPSEFTALPELDGNGDALAIQTLKLENEGCERDDSVTQPTEPNYTLPD